MAAAYFYKKPLLMSKGFLRLLPFERNAGPFIRR